MRRDVLTYLKAHGGAPVTEIQRAFDLPSEMAANLMVQLQDAGLLGEQELSRCSHTAGACGADCAASCSQGNAFERGCCGLNAPYQLTERGQALLAGMS